MDIRDFIDGTPEQKNRFAAMVVQASFAFSAQLIMLCHHYADQMPDEMRDDMMRLLDVFHGYVSEFVDLDQLDEVMQSLIKEDEDDATA